VSNPAIHEIKVPVFLWARMISDLRVRGQGRRESGAFILGRQNTGKAKAGLYICMDDLDPDCYQGGAIVFHAAGYAALWKLCRAKNLDLLCDVHTHPAANVRQSPIDEEHPMVPIPGHTALVVPNFAHTTRWSLNAVGVYEYVRGYEWVTHPPSNTRRVRLTLW
jgi:proteasome lid subunit RPN8/RPN11